MRTFDAELHLFPSRGSSGLASPGSMVCGAHVVLCRLGLVEGRLGVSMWQV